MKAGFFYPIQKAINPKFLVLFCTDIDYKKLIISQNTTAKIHSQGKKYAVTIL